MKRLILTVLFCIAAASMTCETSNASTHDGRTIEQMPVGGPAPPAPGPDFGGRD